MTIIVWLFFIAVLSLYPFKQGPKLIPHADKLIHFAMYAITAALFFSILIKKTRFKQAMLFSVLLTVGYGLLLEILQYLTGRQASPWDAAANLLGALAAMLYIGYRRRWR